MSEIDEADLPSELIRSAIAAGTCPWCTTHRVWKILAMHVRKAHGIDSWTLREMAGLKESASICSDEVSEQRRAAAIERAIWRWSDGDRGPHKKASRMTSAGRKAKSEGIARVAAEKATERIPKHGTRHEYAKYGCRCPLCSDAGRAPAREYQRRKRAVVPDENPYRKDS